jgi:isoleucyl-tRNA synthetase
MAWLPTAMAFGAREVLWRGWLVAHPRGLSLGPAYPWALEDGWRRMEACTAVDTRDALLRMGQSGALDRLWPMEFSGTCKAATAEACAALPTACSPHASPAAVSRSLYAAFPVTSPSAGLAALVPAGAEVAVAIWTTTPWTLPANLVQPPPPHPTRCCTP